MVTNLLVSKSQTFGSEHISTSILHKYYTMGNILERQAAQLLPDANIPPDGNNVNQPYRAQMVDMIAHFAFPLFCLAGMSALGKEYQNVYPPSRQLTVN